MEFSDFKFVYVNTEYLEHLHNADKEILFSPNSNYEQKPHLGILVTCNNHNYVIPLTSAKDKHKNWRDITSTNYRIYEIIDSRTTKIDRYDIVVPENDYNKLRRMGIPKEDYHFYVKRILSVLEIKKMFPVPSSQYTIIDLDTPSQIIDTEQRRLLMQKEYFFCRRLMDNIKEKAINIYNRQMETNEIQPFHCNYKLLEEMADNYEGSHNN